MGINMKKFAKTFALSFLLFFPFVFLYQRHLENTGKSDSIGITYTVYCSLFWVVPAAITVSIIAMWWKGRAH
jgi:glucan phosphoethanolaminetransferase (alkaline phosphatase superfamily)